MAMLHLAQQLLHGVAWETAHENKYTAVQSCEGQENKMDLIPGYDIIHFYIETTRNWIYDFRRREDYSDVILSQRPSSLIVALHCAS